MDSKDFVSIPFLLLRNIGLHNKNTIDLQSKYNLKMNKIFIITTIYLLGALLAFLYYLCTVQHYNSEYIDILNIVLSLGYMTLAIAKGGILLLKRHKLKTIMQDLDEIFPKTANTLNNMNAKLHLSDCTQIAKSFTAAQLIIVWIFNLTPIVESSIRYYIWPGNRIWSFRLPYTTLPFFPYNYDQPVYNIVHYIIQSWIGYMETNVILSLDLFLIGLITQIRMHFEYLNVIMDQMKFNANRSQHIGQFVKKHCKLNRYVSL